VSFVPCPQGAEWSPLRSPPVSAPSNAPLAAFDLDGTLTDRDCLRPFCRSVAGDLALLKALVRMAPLAGSMVRRREWRDRAKAVLVHAVFAGRPASEVDLEGCRFADEVVPAWLRPDRVARLRWHQAQGHATVLVSASLHPYVAPLGAALGVDAVLCTELAVDADGRLTGALAGPNCRAAEKVSRLRGWMGERPADVWAYGDSSGDDEMLAFADHGIRVGRELITAVPVGAAG